MASTTSTRVSESNHLGGSRRNKQQRTDIWSNLLRQTREAQARSRTQAVQTRDLILCGGSAEDQRTFVDRYLARPPPTPTTGRNPRDQRLQRPKGDVRLSNRFGCGYGLVTLFSPAQSSSGRVGLFNGEAEEAAKVDIHTIPEPELAYEATLRRLLQPRHKDEPVNDEEMLGRNLEESEGRRPAVCILMSWNDPWIFLDRLRRWLALLSRSLLPANAPKDESPLDVVKEHQIRLCVALQHTDQQETLLRESYTEQSFDYISQCLRTCLLPLSAALVYVPSSLPPQQPGGPLSEVQKVLYASLDLDIAVLQTKGGKPELVPKHNVVDRMAIVVPSGWDSVGKIRLLSETFSPEAVVEGWVADVNSPVFPTGPLEDDEAPGSVEGGSNIDTDGLEGQSNGGAEVYESSHQTPSIMSSPLPSPPSSPSKMPKSAIKDYERLIQDPDAHKTPRPPEIEVTTKPEQEFLAEMRAQLQRYEAQDAQKSSQSNTSVGAMHTGRFNVNAGGVNATGEALNDLGDVSFNVGGVSYNTYTANEAIERLKRPQPGSSTPDSRSGTPRSSRREPSSGQDDIPTEKLEEYFASLMKKGGGGSQKSTPSKQ